MLIILSDILISLVSLQWNLVHNPVCSVADFSSKYNSEVEL